jgi:seryl-tRNA synthetase
VIDLRRLREDAEYRRGIERKRVRAGLIEEVMRLDEIRRHLASEVEGMRARQNAASKEIGKASPEERQAKILAAGERKLELAAQEAALREVDEELRELALQLPNPADPSVPDGGEDEGEVLKTIGDATDAPPLDHAAFGEALGLVDTVHAEDSTRVLAVRSILTPETRGIAAVTLRHQDRVERLAAMERRERDFARAEQK